jgi:hypothetical protein
MPAPRRTGSAGWLTAYQYYNCNPLPCVPNPDGRFSWYVNLPAQYCHLNVVMWAYDKNSGKYSNVTWVMNTGCKS